ncbi:MAG: TIGR00159 family protein [Vampirovibrionales bacterium]|nr:TIGR00159 family protein [Vampirovibrionales bacterium]
MDWGHDTIQWLSAQRWFMRVNWRQLGQLAFLALGVLYLYMRFIRGSQAEQLFKGLFVILIGFLGLYILADYFNLALIGAALGFGIQILSVALIVIFQPELRRMLLFLGQPDLFGERSLTAPAQERLERKSEYLIDTLTEAVRFLSKSRTGALIVLESENDAGSHYLEAGARLDARLSAEALLTIFHPKTPLHDGAVIITPGNRIAAAGVLLPLTEDPKLSWQFGTRHRAAIGLTEVCDSYCVVVSEESGTISIAHKGKLEKMTGADELKKRLEKIYHVHADRKRDAKEGTRSSLAAGRDDEAASDRFSDQLRHLFAHRAPRRLRRLIVRNPDRR